MVFFFFLYFCFDSSVLRVLLRLAPAQSWPCGTSTRWCSRPRCARPPARSASVADRAGDEQGVSAGGGGPMARLRLHVERPAEPGRGENWLWVTRAGLLRPLRLGYRPPQAPRSPGSRTSGRLSPPLAHRPGGNRLPLHTRRQRVLAPWGGRRGVRVQARGRGAPAPARCPRCTGRTRGAQRGQGTANRLTRRVLGDRGRSLTEDGRPHHRDHAQRNPLPHQQLPAATEPTYQSRRPPRPPGTARRARVSLSAPPPPRSTVLRTTAPPWARSPPASGVHDLPPGALL